MIAMMRIAVTGSAHDIHSMPFICTESHANKPAVFSGEAEGETFFMIWIWQTKNVLAGLSVLLT